MPPVVGWGYPHHQADVRLYTGSTAPPVTPPVDDAVEPEIAASPETETPDTEVIETEDPAVETPGVDVTEFG